MNENSKVKDAAEAVTELMKAVPIYQDLVQPAAKEIGKGLATIAKTVNVAMAPISALVWSYERIGEFVSVRVAEKLRNVSPEKIKTPNPTVAVPALEALRYVGHEESIREMYANLLASAINIDTAKDAHPAFVDIIKNMTADECKIMNHMALLKTTAIISLQAFYKSNGGFTYALSNYSKLGELSGCVLPDYVPSYIDNLIRLGLLEIPPGQHYKEDSRYEILINDSKVQIFKNAYEKNGAYSHVVVEKKKLDITRFGVQFSKACILPT